MLRIVGATLVVALVGSGWLHTPGRMGAHKGRPYIDRVGAVRNVTYFVCNRRVL